MFAATYIHPDSEGQATLTRIETRILNSYNKNSIQAAPLYLLKHALENITLTQ